MESRHWTGDDDREAYLDCTEDVETCGCTACRDWREHHLEGEDCEPPEPDGETYRGGEAEAARWADQMATLRLKR